jgi:phenylalanyl-tRNA synthetase beta chain
MKISYRWLEEYIELDKSAAEVAAELTNSGIEVESMEERGALLKQVIAAEVRERIPHPNSDHLWICQVDTGSRKLQVICGADNCAAGSKVALAQVGTDLGDFTIKKTRLRGEYSEGMLCSERELGISDNHEGIINLPEDTEPGKSLDKIYDISDVIYDVEITPNRPDLLGITGIARDLSSLLHTPFKLPEPRIVTSTKRVEEILELDNTAPDLCTRYTARVIKGVKIAESPQWLKDRLVSVGLRPINNVVDVTNFVMYEYGHPLHAFDYHLVKDHKVIIRRAERGEKFLSLNDEVYELLEDDLVIADTAKAIALAGVIGASNSQIKPDTEDIIIEAANFRYSSVRKTSKRLAIFTDSAYRFERDLSDEQAALAGRRCCELILATAGGELCAGVQDSYPHPVEPVLINLRPSRVEQILSVRIAAGQIRDYLESLGLQLIDQSEDRMIFRAPHYRKDLLREIDLIEEIIRLYGYNNLKSKFNRRKVMDMDAFRIRRNISDNLVHLGFFEVVNWSFGDPEDFERLRLGEHDNRRQAIYLKNPLGASFAIMRTLLLPDVLRNTANNLNHSQKDIKLFEFNKVFFKGSGKLADEHYQICGLLTGLRRNVHWREKQEKVDFYDAKGVVMEILSRAGANDLAIVPSQESWFQPGAAIDIYSGESRLASVGKLDAKVADSYDITVPCYVFDIYLEDVLALGRERRAIYREINKYPPVLRDLSFLIDRRYDLSEVIKGIRETNPELVDEVILFDEYKGKNVPVEKRSLTFNLIFSSRKMTLNDKLIGREMDKIIRGLEKKFGIKMR